MDIDALLLLLFERFSAVSQTVQFIFFHFRFRIMSSAPSDFDRASVLDVISCFPAIGNAVLDEHVSTQIFERCHGYYMFECTRVPSHFIAIDLLNLVDLPLEVVTIRLDLHLYAQLY
jgi:hypothetical protein